MADERSRRSQSRGSLGSHRATADSRYESRHDYRADSRSADSRHRELDHPSDRTGSVVPLLDREILSDRDVGYYHGERGMGYDRVRIDHIDVSRPPPPLPFRSQWPLEPERLPTRGSSDRLDDYHRDLERLDRGGHHGALRPPNWDRMDRNARDEWETRYSREQADRRGNRDEFRDSLPLGVRGDPVRVKTEELAPVDKFADAVIPPLAEVKVEVKTEPDSLVKATEDIGYDDISDDELDDLIGGAEDEQEDQPVVESMSEVVDILDIKWESLVSEDRQKLVVSGSALRRFTIHHILGNMGVSAAFAGDALVRKLKSICQQQMDDEVSKMAAATDSQEAEETVEEAKEVKKEAVSNVVKSELTTDESKLSSQPDSEDKETLTAALTMKEKSVPRKFEILDDVAVFHATAVKKLQERQMLVTNIGPHRRALCARRDLAVRRALCKIDKDEVVIYPAQAVDQDMYKLSVQLFRQDRERRPSASATPVVLPTAAVH